MVFPVVPVKKEAIQRSGIFIGTGEGTEALQEVGAIFQRLDLRLGRRALVLDHWV